MGTRLAAGPALRGATPLLVDLDALEELLSSGFLEM